MIVDNKRINDPFLDKRVRLLPCQKEMLVYWRDRGMSQRALAKMFRVSRRTIQFAVDSHKLSENKIRREERGGWRQYYDKEANREYAANHRDHKNGLFNKKTKRKAMSKNSDSLHQFRFKIPGTDPRPIGWPPPGPFWATGYSDTHVVVVSFAESLEVLLGPLHWPDAEDVEDLGIPSDLYSDRFPKPDWWPIDYEKDPWCGSEAKNDAQP